MSLWSKPIDEIAFADVDAFCRTMQPEGARLDYKGFTIPKDLPKTIAAFANTLGGLILLGVDADKTTNKPIWPPQSGMPTEVGLQERVFQLAHDAISPPVRVSVSNVIEIPELSGKAILVIRVHESSEAPHATEKNRKVYVYERTDNKNEPYELADVNRIEYLLKRRNRLQDAREAKLHENLTRANSQMHPSKCPIRWVSIAPVYPWQEVCDPQSCVTFHKQHFFPGRMTTGAHWGYQNCVGGSFATAREVRVDSVRICIAVSSVSSSGTVFGATYIRECRNDNETLLMPNEDLKKGWLGVSHQANRDAISAVVAAACHLYRESKNPPGDVMISFGIKNAKNVHLFDYDTRRRSQTPYMDEEYRVDEVLNSQEVAPTKIEKLAGLFDAVTFAFNGNQDQM
ncbi:AlbA family DNA-binding domain-containing protein [Anatilimnocola floriformis]|uniref:AlbA family DNA-binding domain-containing protein n=1 Tax=Anatilimnocola floriformis TaxID=2948575 RepID=UPI0020C41A01|nr:ATP-binding protein [Anatilimnocola floriformis]